MFVKRILSDGETTMHREIQKGLTSTGYHVYAKLPLSEVIGGAEPQLAEIDKNFLYGSASFDFVVCDSNHVPQFAVEFDGPPDRPCDEHEDIRKNRICALAQFRLIRVCDAELEQHDRVSLLSFMVDRFVKWQEEHPRICSAIEEEIAEMPKSELERLTDGVLDPSIDPDFHFDIRHPFPGTDEYQQMLEKRHGILRSHSDTRGKRNLWHEVGIIPDGPTTEGGSYTCTYAYGIYRGGKNGESFEWHNGHLTSPGVEVIHEGQISVTMKWSLSIDERYDHSISPFEFQLEHGVNPVYFSEIPGAFTPDIARQFCLYLAYKRLCDWAHRNARSE